MPRYDADKLAGKLVQKCRSSAQNGGAYFDWLALGVESGVCFNSVPWNVTFLNGPLTDERELSVRQTRKRAPRQTEEDAEEQKPENVEGGIKRDVDNLSAVEQNMKVLRKTLRKRVDDTYKTRKRILKEKFDIDFNQLYTITNMPIGRYMKQLKRDGVADSYLSLLRNSFNPSILTTINTSICTTI